MPAVSKKQRVAAVIAEHAPEKLYKRNRAMLSMTHKQLHDFASTKGIKKSTKGSPPMKGHELACGYRKLSGHK